MKQGLIVVAVVAFTACGLQEGARTRLAASAQNPPGITTDSGSYIARPNRLLWSGNQGEQYGYAFTVIVRAANHTRDTLFLTRCFPTAPTPEYGVERWDTVVASAHDRVGSAYDPMWACVGHDRDFVLAPGTARTDTLHLRGPNAVDAATHQPLGVLEGQFRIAYRFRRCQGFQPCTRPDTTLLSNAFLVRRSDERLGHGSP